MVDIYVEYEGGLHCRAQHGPSQNVLVTDAPVDNNGRGEAFSPTDLVATGLGTCMATVMGMLARKRGYDLDGTRVHVKKKMTQGPPRRIAELAVAVVFPSAVTARVAGDRASFEHEAHVCPVRMSLLGAIAVPVDFDWHSE